MRIKGRIIPPGRVLRVSQSYELCSSTGWELLQVTLQPISCSFLPVDVLHVVKLVFSAGLFFNPVAQIQVLMS